MTVTLQDKGAAFAALHEAPGVLLLANAWDAGSARILAGLGYRALATSSGAIAGVFGRRDGGLSRDEALAAAGAIAAATDLPVSADLENGFGHAPGEVAHTITLAGAAGLVGASIEDASGDPAQPIYPLEQAVARIAAAAEAARALPFRFMLAGRAENWLRGRPDLDDTIRRLQAFERAGADLLFAPGLPDLDAVRTVCASLSRPFNFMVGMPGRSFSVAELEAAGVRRISLASTLYRAAMSGLIGAAREALEAGTFGYLERGLPGAEISRHMRG
ncbi:MAG: isocitrate lyase/phosphoenolpyruvate mutase family protein [Burkholderiaceae bacterium]|nr:MAG: isocitrate lyase/phosphoenolpyruvate mutase family protein [Burkholderiaceae bacterium]